MGVINFYKLFIFIKKLASPLVCSLTGKNTFWDWDDEAEEEFQCLKKALVEAPILSHPIFSEELCLSTDSSYMKADNTVLKTIGFGSRILSKSESNYSVTELEALAVVWGFEKFRYFLYGRKTRI